MDQFKTFLFVFHVQMQEVRVALPNVVHVVRLYSVSGKYKDFCNARRGCADLHSLTSVRHFVGRRVLFSRKSLQNLKRRRQE